jgi:hypothetical protein
MTTFKKGDRVRVDTGDTLTGRTGRVVQCGLRGLYPYKVTLDDEPGSGYGFDANELTKITSRRLTVRRSTASSTAGWTTKDGELEQYFEGEFEFEVEDLDPNVYVQVDYSSNGIGRVSPLYTYIDPTGGDLRVGDLVEVPVTYGTKVGRVAKLGKGDYTGPCKTVAARVVREAL